jgi:hypothetical protein
MEFEDHYVTCSLKHTMEHWLWCAVLLIEVFGLFWCLMVKLYLRTYLLTEWLAAAYVLRCIVSDAITMDIMEVIQGSGCGLL